MQMTLKPLLAVCLFGALVPADAQPTDPAVLVIKWQKGKKYTYLSEATFNTETTLPGYTEAMKQGVSQRQTFAYSVLEETTDGGKAIEMEFLTVRMELDVMNNRIAYDSEDPAVGADNPRSIALSEPLQHLAGMKCRYTLNGKGEVEKIDGLKEALSNLTDLSERSNTMLSEMLNDENLRNMFRMAFQHGAPDKAMSPGASWPFKTRATMGTMKYGLDAVYTFKEWTTKNDITCARIEYEGTFTLSADANPNFMGMDTTPEGGRIKGVLHFDPNRGVLLDHRSTSEATMKLEMSGPQGTQTGSLKTTQVQTLSLLDIEDLP